MFKEKPIILVIVFIILMIPLLPLYAQEGQKVPETKIEIKISGQINGEQQAKIDELMGIFANQNPKLKIDSKDRVVNEIPANVKTDKEDKFGKYYFLPIIVSLLIMMFLLFAFIKIKNGARQAINKFNNFVLGFIFLANAVLGIFLIFDVKLFHLDVKFWHVVSGEVLIVAIIFHLFLHWAIWKFYFKKFFSSRLFLKATDSR
ncbi:MAG: hypothetical protein A2817_01215 [Candidatus Yanofskybacteria bacterium RIFCSPHIGHO2_01_FULL_39_8b]|uniref:DUF4405 domain-containing protein n=1 Tax=Candidatus Yanofskybacteria bacterium RIFCSPHIGHO2_01_FULL_39_8b TaxID=1802659 RepID=A0A1F8EFJ8_9BACT|nr:MAG: hypothetical protein A2817_01215 [Candidatus Yanofskybacteria bacterium RIFCSPHIGHO2_01_FULL_39_8b]